jgi:hypothetical protein
MINLCSQHLLLLFDHADLGQVFFLDVDFFSDDRLFNCQFVLISFSLVDGLIIFPSGAYLVYDIVT